MRSRAVALLVLVACVGGDQVTKRLATERLAGRPAVNILGGLIRLDRVENAGGFLGLGSSLPGWIRSGVYVGGVGLGLALLAAYLMRRPIAAPRAAALALVLGGGSSNWIDRVVRGGTVVDFVQLRLGPLHTGVFNFADASILAGGFLLLWFAARPAGAAGRG